MLFLVFPLRLNKQNMNTIVLKRIANHLGSTKKLRILIRHVRTLRIHVFK